MTTPTGPDITKMGIIDILMAIFDGQTSKGPGNKTPAGKGQIWRAFLRSPCARRIFTAQRRIDKHATELRKRHEYLHRTRTLSHHECDADHSLWERLNERASILAQMFGQAVIEEYPQFILNPGVCIAHGWNLFCPENSWNDNPVAFDRSNIALNIMDNINTIVHGAYTSVDEENLGPVGTNEEVIGTVTDERIQTLYNFVDEVRAECRKVIPRSFLMHDPQFLSTLAGPEMKRLGMMLEHFLRLNELILGLCWSAIGDSIPASVDAPHTGIRRAWEVVKYSDRDHGENQDSQKNTLTIHMVPIGMPSELPFGGGRG